MLELLDHIGRATLEPLWLPVLVWTVVAVPVWLLIRYTSVGRPLTRYWTALGVLFSLPVGVSLYALGWRLPSQTVESIVVIAGSEPALDSWMTVTLPAVSQASTASGDWSVAMVVAGLATVLGLLVGTIAVLKLLRSLWALRRLDRSVTAEATPGSYQSVVFTDRVPVPVTYGVWHPVILLPTSLRCDPDQALLALQHERVHVRRRDHLLHLVARVTASFFAVHPLCHALVRTIEIECEHSCDRAVLRESNAQPSTYARLLLRFASVDVRLPAPMLRFARPQIPLSDRIRAMTESQQPVRPKRSLIIASVAAVVVAVLMLSPRTSSMASQAAEAISSPATLFELPELAILNENEADEPSITTEAPEVQDSPPAPVGGMQTIQEQIRYPQEAREQAMQGTTKIAFLVTADGTVSDIEVHTSAGAVLDYEIVRVLLNTDFEPATREGEPYTADITFPVTFVLQGGRETDIEPISHEYDEDAIETTFTLPQVVVTGIGP